MKDLLNKYQIIIIITLIGIALLIVTRSCSRVIENNIRQYIKNDEKPTNEYLIKYKDDWINLIAFLLQGKIDFKDFPLSKNFLNKYNVANDVLKGKVMGTHDAIAQTFDITEDIEKHIMTIGVKTGNGFEEVAYQLHYVINEKNELDDIEILDSKVIEDENGEFIQYDKYILYDDDKRLSTYILVFPQSTTGHTKVYVTDKFKAKFSNYESEGILEDKDYLIYGEVTQDKENEEMCYVECLDIEYTKIYKITYIIDEKGYIDDAEIELYETKKTEDPEYVKNFYEGWLENH